MKFPGPAKFLIGQVQVRFLGRDEAEAQRKHFTPTYNPWEQRICMAPEGKKEKKKSCTPFSLRAFNKGKNDALLLIDLW